jgi:hypothetical protein
VKELNSKMVFTSFSSIVNTNPTDVIEEFLHELPNVQIIATGHAFEETTIPAKITFISNSQDLIKLFGKLDPTMVH